MALPYKTLREKYEAELSSLYSALDGAQKARAALMSGSVSSYSLGNRSVTYMDMDKIDAFIKDAQARCDELEALLSGRSPRCVQTHSFVMPSCALWRT